MPKFLMQETIQKDLIAARLGAGTGTANNLTDIEIGKPVKMVGESRYNLTAAGEPIEGFITAVEGATADGYTLGSVQTKNRKTVTADGLQATPGTGTIAIGDYVVTGTVVAKGTALPAGPKVCKATDQPGTVPAALSNVGPQIKNTLFAWRVVSLGAAGTGAVGTTIVIERVTA